MQASRRRYLRLSSRMTYALPKTRTNYGFFNIRYQGAKIRNDISDNIKLLSLKQFKKNLKSIINASYVTEYCTVHFLSSVSLSAYIYFIFLLIFAKLHFNIKLGFVFVFLCCICYLKKYMTPLKITVFKTLRMAVQFY